MADAIRILYVDDELGLLEIAKLYLEESGEFSVTTIDSVSAALDLLGKEKFDVIISDYQMPGKDGIQFLVEVRTRFGKIPFILFTGKGREEVVIQAINSGADFYLQKGGEPESQFAELSHKTHSAISRKRADEALLKSTEELHAAYEELAATEAALRANLDELTLQEQAQRESEEKFRSLAESSPDYIMRYDPQCRHMYMNPAALRVSGLSEDKIIGKTHRETGFDERQSQFWEEKINEVFKTGKPYQTQFEWESVGGHVVLDWMLTPEFNDGGTVLSVLGVSRDVTHLKKVEDELLKKNEELQIHQVELETQAEELIQSHLALEESRDKFLDLYEFAPIGYLTLNDKALIKEVNLTCATLLGVERSTLVNHGLGGFIAPECHDEWDQYFVNIRQHGGKHTCNLTFIRSDGSLFPAWLGGIRFIDGKGVIAIRIAISDITERKQVEDKLRESEAQKTAILDGITTNIAFVDKDLKILWANKVAAESVHKSPTEMIGYTCHTFWADPAHPCENCPTLKVFETNQSEHAIMHTPDGRVWDERGEPVVDKQGNLIGVVEIAQDITELKQTEDALRESEEKYRIIFENAGDAIAIHDFEGNFVEVNDVICKRLGYSREELLKMKAGDVDGPVHALKVEERIQELNKNGHLIFETVHITRDGRQIPTEVSSIVFNLGDKPFVMSIARDITERKQVEEALKKSDERLRFISDNLTSGVVIVDAETHTIEFANLAASALFMTTSDNIIGKKCHKFLCPADEGACPISDLNQEVDNAERLLLCIDGTTIPILKSVKRIQIGGREKLLENFIDITDQKRAENELRNIRQQLELALKGADEGIIDWNLTSGTITFNDTVSNMLGYTPIEFPNNGSEFLSLIHPDDRIEGNSHFLNHLQGKTPAFYHEERFRTASGEWKWILARGKIVEYDELGKPQRYVGTHVDITERKRMENSLRESEDKYRSLVEHSLEGILILDLQGTILFANNAVAHTIESDDLSLLIGRNVMEFISPESREDVVRDLIQVNQGHDAYLAQYNAISEKGNKFSVESMGKIISYEGKPADLISIRDITKRKQMEEIIRQTNRKLNLLSSITRHDINNQLLMQRGYLDILKNKQHDPSFNEYIQRVITAAERISALIQFTKEYENIGINTPFWQDCRKLVETAVRQAPLKHVIVNNVLPTGEDVFADPLIIKVFYNLMDNAVRYGGKITTIRFYVLKSGDDHLIVCEDDGEGIPIEEKEKIFERGFGKNTGLGLALSREILDITGITIRETGEPGTGARFEITVPNGKWRYESEAS